MMATLGISPSNTKPAFLTVRTTSSDILPRGGILRNGRRESDIGVLPPSPTGLQSSSVSIRRESEPVTPPPTTPSELVVTSLDSPNSQPRIRFAPLPDPRRSPSHEELDPLDVKDEAVLHTYEVQGAPPVEYDLESEQMAVMDRDIALDDSEDEEGATAGGRRWSKSMSLGMGGSWKGTKKLLGMSNDKVKDYFPGGAPLKKMSSTGTSFKSVAENDRRKVFQGLPLTPTTSHDTAHRRNSSLEPTPSSLGSSLGASPQPPVRMLNGRVYGSRRASEAAARQRELREKTEPAFVEWGIGKQGGVGSNAPNTDDEDGSGMEWVKRRREERQRRQAAERESVEQATVGEIEFTEPTLSSSVGSQSDNGPPLTPNDASRCLPTPIIQVSEPPSSPTGVLPSLAPELKAPITHVNSAQPLAPPLQQSQPLQHQQLHTKAIAVPQRTLSSDRDVFDEADRGSQSADEDYDDGDDDVDDDEEDDGDFSEDEEEEEAVRTTSSAAGVEVVSRHKNYM